MGRLETEVKKEIRRTKINKAIIGTIAAAGTLSIAAVVPGLLTALGPVKFSAQRRYLVKGTLARLKEYGYVAYEGKGQDMRIRLTEKGERFAALMEDGGVAIQKPKRWDGKWRVLIFDISESKKALRNKVRSTLVTLGFVRLQDSVWVHPYDCEDFILLLKADFKIGKEVLYIIADKIENDKELRTRFDLPLT